MTDELEKKIDSITSAMQQTNEMMQKLAEQVVSQQEMLSSLQSKGQEKKEDKKINVDLESMGNTELAMHIIDQVSQLLDQKVKPVEDKASEAINLTSRESVSRLIDKAAEQYPDFYEWTDEMQKLAEENPTLSPERLYKLARSENPDKAAEIDGKEKGEEKESPLPNKEDSSPSPSAKQREKQKEFGGLPPGNAPTEPKTNLTQDDAAQTAWDEALAEFGGNVSELLGQS